MKKVLMLLSVIFLGSCGLDYINTPRYEGTYQVTLERRIGYASACYQVHDTFKTIMYVDKENMDSDFYIIRLLGYEMKDKISPKGGIFSLETIETEQIVLQAGFKGNVISGLFTIGHNVTQEGWVSCFDDYYLDGIKL